MNFHRPAKAVVFFLLVFNLLFPIMAQAAQAPDMLTTVTTGEQIISGQNLPGAKQKAVNQALERAVQNAFSALVPRQVFASNLEFLYDRLIPRAADYVVTYRVLDGLEHKGTYLVGVESKIDLARMKTRLTEAKILKSGKDKPVVLFFIAEQTPDDLMPRYWWGNNPKPYSSLAEEQLQKELASGQIPMAHAPGATYPNPGEHNIQFGGIYDARAAMDLGRALNADIIIMGKASAQESANRMGDARTFQSSIELEGWDLSGNTQIFQVFESATTSSSMASQGINAALTQASVQAGQQLVEQINAFWNQSQRQAHPFDLVIEGDQFLSRFIALKQRMGEIQDIENMQPREIGSNHAVMEVIYKGSAKEFADDMLLKTFEGFGIEIREVTPDTVKIEFVNQGSQPAQPKAMTPPGENSDQ